MTEPNSPQPTKKSLSNDDAVDLEKYFCQYRSAFSRSITGPMLTRAELYSSGTFPCYYCQEFPGINEKTGDWCKPCKGTGFISFHLKGKEDITAYPTAEVVESKGYEPSLQLLQDYGRISRRLDGVKAALGKEYLAVLEDYHGDLGARWGRTRWGRLFAIYPRTKAGRALVIMATEEAKGENEVVLTPVERLGVQAELQRVKPSSERKRLLAACREQAEAMYDLAVQAYISTAPLRPARSKPKVHKEKEKWAEQGKPAREVYGADGQKALRQTIKE